ncbi:hypothetical protein M422DRAFT_780581 [Sphaerobolus stellatus SS14]|uniref:Tyrosinase copper-binding domain-containing protein n=1 Tax=Sphaerobolus stellatus (strain SS14) TaxID=990650 RepID=A0A0C9VHR2_SPHS4|nr:hypothetical protein M422DRAFT_780581 [Sphaerobolus stellatus SS14]
MVSTNFFGFILLAISSVCSRFKQTYTLEEPHCEEGMCILTKHPLTNKTEVPAVGSRYDDFVATHNIQTDDIHFVRHFFPWHRWYVSTYEKALRNECDYKGAQPYWDWTLDVRPNGKWVDSPVFDPVYGFECNGPWVETDPAYGYDVPGRTGGGCVQDGPLVNMTVRLGAFNILSGNPRCLARDLSPYFAGRYLGANLTKSVMSGGNFASFARAIEAYPDFEASSIHGDGHYGVGGLYGAMGDLYNNPSDPLFFLHHGNLDRVWWSWQAKNLNTRLYDIDGPIYYYD